MEQTFTASADSIEKTDTSTLQEFTWTQIFADLVNVGCAVVSPKLDIIFASGVFNESLNLQKAKDGKNLTFFELIEIMAKRGDFGSETPDTTKTAIYRALDDQMSSGSQTPFSICIINPIGQTIELSMKALPDQKVLITTKQHQPKSDDKPYISEALALGETGYCYLYPKTGEFKLYADAFFSHLDLEKANNANSIEDLWDFIFHEDIAKAQAAFAAVIKTQCQTDINLRINSKFENSIWVRARISPTVDQSGEVLHILCTFTDITQTLRVQQQLRDTVEQSDKALKATTGFLGRLSHEIRTPMNAVIGISDALIHHHADPVIQPKLELIQTSAEKIVRIVDETLQHTKLDEDKLELNPVIASPKSCVEAVCALWSPKAEKEEIDLSYQIDPSVPDEIVFDSLRYEQCLNNLISNAVKFTHGGKIQVVLTTLQKETQKQLVLVVKDTGIGMTQEQQATIFDPFTQADKSISGRFGGTGLGMNITKRMIELMGGKISMRSEEGKGSVFALTMPIKMPEQLPEPAKTEDLVRSLLDDAAPEQSNYADLRVLVADDNQTNHMVISSLLGSVVKEIHVAEDGAEAIEVLKTKEIDLIFMDIHMPVMDGIEATLSIRGSTEPWADIPIIALTADPQYQQKRLCKNIGMDGALAKPVKLTELLSAIDQIRMTNSQNKAA